jgi:phage terminase large subunit
VNRENWGFLKTTFRDNPALSKNEKDTLLSYDPANPINVERKTADARRWAIYGEGKDAMSDDMVITKWEHFTSEPTSFDYVFYGLDFGYSKDPTALTKTWVNGKDIYCQLLLYEVGVDFKKIASLVDTDSMVFCDNDKISINELLLLNICAVPAKKGAFSVIRGVNFLNNHNLYIKDLYVENLTDGIGGFAFESELLSYHYKKTNAGVYVISNGNKVPTDKNNHAIDSWRYSVSNIYENN